jgi:hypothetical protein
MIRTGRREGEQKSCTERVLILHRPRWAVDQMLPGCSVSGVVTRKVKETYQAEVIEDIARLRSRVDEPLLISFCAI